MKVMGRPRKEFSQEYFEKLCALQCTQQEIASFFDMTDDTLNARCKEIYDKTFSGVYKTYADRGRMSLRRRQLQVAMRGSIPMLIWLGKQYLGQADKQEQSITTDFDGDEKASKHYDEYAGRIFRQLNDKAGTRRF